MERDQNRKHSDPSLVPTNSVSNKIPMDSVPLYFKKTDQVNEPVPDNFEFSYYSSKKH